MEIDEGTIIEMVVVLGLIDVITMVGTVHVHTESFGNEHFMYYELWSEGFIIFSCWFLKWKQRGRLFTYLEQDLFAPFCFICHWLEGAYFRQGLI